MFFPITKERTLEALGLLDQAIAIDRHYGRALAWAAICHMQLVASGWAEMPETSRNESIDLARRALQVAQNDPGILAAAALALARFSEDINTTIGLAERALALNPSYAGGWYVSGLLRLWAGQPDLAIEHIETALRLSPREPLGAPLFVMGAAYFFKRQLDEATAKLLSSIQDHPGLPSSYRFLAACYAQMGRLDEARAIVAKLLAVTPLVFPSDCPTATPRTASCTCRACAWRPARWDDPDPPSRRDPRRRCCGVFAAGGGRVGRRISCDTAFWWWQRM